jgi:endonuclease YncB( thermonuclease family)
MPGHRLPSLLILLALLQAGPAAAAPAFRATVLSVGDGDTLRVRSGQQRITIRLACIDAPETAQSPWGQQARQALLMRLAVGRPVTIQPRSTDRFGRTVAEVRGVLVVVEMTTQGVTVRRKRGRSRWACCRCFPRWATWRRASPRWESMRWRRMGPLWRGRAGAGGF